MKVLRAFATTCAVIALVFACFGIGGDPQRAQFNGDESDGEMSSPALSESASASTLEPPVVPRKRGSVVVDARPPHGFLTTPEVFRPPRAAA